MKSCGPLKRRAHGGRGSKHVTVSKLFYISDGGEPLGPYEIAQLRAMWNTGQITADHLYWNESSNDWRGISELALEKAAEAPSEQKPQQTKGILRVLAGTTKRETPVQYWMWRIGSIGLGIGFLMGLQRSASLDILGSVAFALGAAMPAFVIFAAVGAVVGRISAWRQKSR
jgi:hypothetical protein